MLKYSGRAGVFVLLLAVLTIPAGLAGATDTSTSQATTTSSTTSPAIVSGTDPEPTSPNVIQVILTFLNLD